MLHLQLPRHVHHFFKTFRVLSHARHGVHSDETVRVLMQMTSDEHRDYVLRNFMTRSKVVRQHLPPHTPQIVHDMLNSWEPLSPLERLLTLELLKPISGATSIVPAASHYARKFSEFEASLLCKLQASCNPHQTLPRTTVATKLFQWYSRVLQDTPVVLILAIRDRLFSDDSLQQMDINRAVMKLKTQRLSNATRARTASHRAYHFTDLASKDIFKLAVASQHLFADAAPEQYSKIIDSIHDTAVVLQDALCEQLWRDRITFHDGSQNAIPEDHIIQMLAGKDLKAQRAEIRRDPDSFTYDMQYTSHYMMTIEKDALTEPHDKLMDVIEASPFAVVGARLSLKHGAISDFVRQDQFSQTARPRQTYQELIDHAAENHPEMAAKKHISDLFRRLAGFGLVKVVPKDDALYLINGTN